LEGALAAGVRDTTTTPYLSSGQQAGDFVDLDAEALAGVAPGL
jgi:hypothetical protein